MFDRVSLPTPFQVGPVNAYLAGRTLVDPGPDSDEAWASLLDELERRELAPADVEQVLITHPHPDHFGVAKRLHDAGARVLASQTAASIVEDFPARLEYEQRFFSDFFERCGMAPDEAETVTKLPEAFLHYAESVPIDQMLAASDTVTVDDQLVTVDEITGHAPGELLFAYDGDAGRTAIVGDNVLADITPNPFLQPPDGDDAERPRVLPEYNRSLERLRGERYDRFLPGHRAPITSPSERIESILAEHDERTDRVHSLLDDPATPADVMNELFPDLPVTEAFSGMSEAVGHLDVLEERGAVTVRESGGLLVYERVE